MAGTKTYPIESIMQFNNQFSFVINSGGEAEQRRTVSGKRLLESNTVTYIRDSVYINCNLVCAECQENKREEKSRAMVLSSVVLLQQPGGIRSKFAEKTETTIRVWWMASASAEENQFYFPRVVARFSWLT